ncbi:MAG: UDP-3-O-(3-hydroxymyristoyl)glucosamine N-acyltransferase [Chitinophagales bacterium]
MQISAKQINQWLGGTIEGEATVSVSALGKIETAEAGQLSFLANPKYEAYIYTTKASIVIVNRTFAAEKPIAATLIRVDDAYSAFSLLLEKYQATQQPTKRIEQPSFIHETAKIAANIYVGAFAYIGANVSIGENANIYPQAFLGENVRIGKNVTIHTGVKIYHGCEIGDSCIIHAGTIIGADGFGFAPQANGSFKKVPQIGKVIIENNVEIGANTCIDRATLGETIIRKGAKIDNLIQIAHNVEIGENTVIAAQTGISGSTKLGKNCFVGGQVGFVGHLAVANGTKISAQSGVSKSVKQENKILSGTPAFEHKNALRSQVMYRKLPTIAKRIKMLEQKMKS